MPTTSAEQYLHSDNPEPAPNGAPSAGPTGRSPPHGGAAVFTFDDMYLQVGDRLQVECPGYMGAERAAARLIGHVENVSLLITRPTSGRQRFELRDGEVLVVRAFSRQTAFAFRASVSKVCRAPFDYLHLSYPAVVEGSVIRKATRVRTRWAARWWRAGEGSGEGGSARIDNLSATGMLLSAHEALGAKGDRGRIAFEALLHGVPARVEVEAEILHVMPGSAPAAEAGERIHHGVEFRELRPNDLMTIKSLVYQEIIEHPHSII